MKRFLTLMCLFFVVITTCAAGYVGTLPNIDDEFSYLRKEISEKASAPFSVEESDKANEMKLKPVPRENDDYIDIIIKKDKTSKYTNDINSITVILEKLRRCINTEQNIQMFNAIVSNLIDNIEYLRIEYQDKPESNYLSYNKLIQLSAQAANTARLRTQALASGPYIPYTSEGNIYTQENIQKHLEDLLINVNETVFILKNLE